MLFLMDFNKIKSWKKHLWQAILQDYDLGLQPGHQKRVKFIKLWVLVQLIKVSWLMAIQETRVGLGGWYCRSVWPRSTVGPNPGLWIGPQILSFLYRVKILYFPLMKQILRGVIAAQWYQIVGSTVNSPLNNHVNNNMLLDKNMSNEPNECSQMTFIIH